MLFFVLCIEMQMIIKLLCFFFSKYNETIEKWKQNNWNRFLDDNKKKMNINKKKNVCDQNIFVSKNTKSTGYFNVIYKCIYVWMVIMWNIEKTR